MPTPDLQPRPNLERVRRENAAMRRQLDVFHENERLKAALAARGMAAATAPATIRSIAEDVAHEHGLAMAALIGPRRTTPVVRARQEAMWRCRQVRRPDGSWRYSLPQIGHFFGRDHTTVLVAVRRHAELLSAQLEPTP